MFDKCVDLLQLNSAISLLIGLGYTYVIAYVFEWHGNAPNGAASASCGHVGHCDLMGQGQKQIVQLV
jgi:hypothetical protein